jgi:hypothetical protein
MTSLSAHSSLNEMTSAFLFLLGIAAVVVAVVAVVVATVVAAFVVAVVAAFVVAVVVAVHAGEIAGSDKHTLAMPSKYRI